VKNTEKSGTSNAVSENDRELIRHPSTQSVDVLLIWLFLFVEELVANDHVFIIILFKARL